MDVANIEDIVANDLFIHAKNGVENRKKYVKKVRFPDDSICAKTLERVKAKLNANKGSETEEQYQFRQMCLVEPIGNKLFREYSTKSDKGTKNASDFLLAVEEYELDPEAGSREAKLKGIVSNYLNAEGAAHLNYISDDAKAPLITAIKSGTDEGLSALASLSLENMQNEKVFNECIRQALDLGKSEVISYMAKEVFKKYKESEEFRTYLKWKYIEGDQANESCFTQFRLLGRGGFGEVYAYQEHLTGTLYACKKIDKKRMKKKNAEHTILIEKEVLERVNSRFVVTLYYAYQSKKELNLIMTLLSGGDLKFHIYEVDRKNKGVSPERCKIYSAQITMAMEHLHSENILYRDMKPENVLLDSRGNCRVADLGLACILQENEKTSGKAGTLGYMPPEMLNNSEYAYGVDWFAVGCTIYEMCEGRGPFIVRDKSKRKIDKDLTAEKTKNDDVAYKREHKAELLHLIGALLAKDVNERLAEDLPSARPIMDHPYFEEINWERLEAGLIEPPFIPSDDEVYAKNASNIKLPSDAEGIKLTDEDAKLYEEFSTGRNPAPWQEEIISCGVYDEIMELYKSGACPKFVVKDEGSKSKFCTIL